MNSASTLFRFSIILLQILVFFILTPFDVLCSYHPSEEPLTVTSEIRNKKWNLKNKISQLALQPLHSPRTTCTSTTKSSLSRSNISESRRLMS